MANTSKNVRNDDANREYSPRKIARAIGVSESTVKRWCDQDLLVTHRTAGGHRRVPLSSVVALLRENGQTLKHPDLLGLPRGKESEAIATVGFLDALRGSDLESIRRFLLGAFREGRSIAALFDQVVTPAFHTVGELWAGGELEIFREHRAVEISLKALRDLEQLVPPPKSGAPAALIASLSGDPYCLPLAMAELVLASEGWSAQSLGPNHPVDTLMAAFEQTNPDVLLLSLSATDSREELVANYQRLFEHARRRRVAVVIGGRLLDERLCQQLSYTSCCATMQQLVNFAQGFWRAE